MNTDKKTRSPKMRILLIVGIALIAVIVTVIVQTKEPSTNNNTISIVTSFYPLAEFATQVGGSRVTVQNVTPVGAEPHDFEPTPKQIQQVLESDLFIHQGGGFDPWADAIRDQANSQHVTIVNMLQQMGMISARSTNTDTSFALIKKASAQAPQDQPAAEETFLVDPHTWLDPVRAKQEVEIIKQALITIDPAGKQTYLANATTYEKKLDELDTQFKSRLVSCQKHDIIVSHNAFSYLAARYNFSVLSIAGFSPDTEPSNKELSAIISEAKEKQLTTVFKEPLVSSTISNTVASEINGHTKELNPIEGLTPEQQAQGETYLSLMQENLDQIQDALVCQ